MRNITRCDICNKEKSMDKPIRPEGFVLMNGLDFCEDCYKEFNKRERKLIKDLQKEKFTLPQDGGKE